MKLRQQNLLAAIAAFPALTMAQLDNRPNIIILNIDDMGFSDPACFSSANSKKALLSKLREYSFSTFVAQIRNCVAS